jgi:uncharacterized protein (UPF0305 family)
MKASQLLENIRRDLKDYPIEYLKNKADDDRYPDSITKKLAKYNSNVYDDIYGTVILDDFEIKDNVIVNMTSDLESYFEMYGPGDMESQDFIKNISLYLALIAKKPLHPYSEDKKDEIYYSNGKYYCKNRVTYINDENSLCRYCACRNVGFMDMF